MSGQSVEVKPFAVIQVKVSTLFRIKSNCRARFSAFIGSQLWERIIQCVISCGAQPFPKQNIISLNVSLSPIGLAQNILWYSCGHDFKGKNALPFMVSNSSLRSAITSCLLSKRNLLRYSFRVAISQNALQASVCILFKPMIVVFYPFYCLKISHVLCFININAAGFVPSRLKEIKRKNALPLRLSNNSLGLAIVLVC